MSLALTFEPEGHLYTVNGRPVPSVTTILRAVNLIDFSAVRASVLEYARDRGVLVHQAVQFDIEGRLDPASVDDEIRPYVEAARAWRRDSGFRAIAVEYRLYHSVWDFAGTADLVGWLDGRQTVVDWKTGRASDAVADLQLAAYAAALRQTPPAEWFHSLRATPIQRLAIELTDAGTYTVHRYLSARDLPLFLQCLGIYREQVRRGLRVAA